MNKTSAALVRSLLLGTSCLSAIAAAPALAQPTGGTVTFGQGTITNHGGNSTVIDQKTGKLVINWDSFSVGAGGTVQFVQPGTGSIALNRVTGSEPTAIYGNLLANGQVWIINGNGVLFGAGSQIKVGGILATTADIRDADFAAGNYSFSGGTGASVVNQGTIQTRGGGSVVLSGASAQNRGLIVANTGSVVIGGASAFTVDFTGDGLIKYAITAPARTADNGQTGASNSGTIKAAGGQVVMTARAAADVQDAVVNNTGMISATSAHVRNGEVVLDGGDGNVAVAGTIDASGSGSGTTGGSVTVTGRNITVADNTRIDASGDAGGGTIRIGGDLHGQGTLPQAQNVDVGKATITADARRSGDGGTLVVWSTGTTDFSGIVSLKGGAGGGDGGLVETSGHNLHVASTATFDTRAPKGKAGTWLIDPDYIYIEDDGTAALDGGNDTVGDNPGGLDVIAPSTIIGALATTNVSLQAVHEIDVYNDIDYDSAHTLSLLAGADIYVAANVQNAGTGAINVIAGWDGTTTDPAHFLDPGVYGHSGQVFVTSDFERQPGLAEPPANEVHPVSVGSAGGTTTIAGSAVNIFAYYALSQIGYHGAGGGDIVVRATADVVLDGSWGFAAAIGNGLPEGGGAANVTGNIDIGAPGVLSLLAGEGAGAPWIGNRTSGPGIESGSVSLVVGGVTSNMSFGAPGSLGAMLLADLGTTAQAGSGGDVTFGITNPHTDYINADLGIGTMDYSSPHALTLLSTESITLPYSIQNSGTGDLTILAGWDPKVAPADVLTTPGAYGNPTSEISDNGGATGAHIWVVGASGGTLFDYNPGNPSGAFSIGASGVGTAIGSKGGTTTVGAAQIYIEGLSGYAQIGYHGDGGTGDINVIANGVPGTGDLTGIGACFDGDANVCVIGGRSGWGDNAGDPTYAQIGDLGFGVAGTASSNITISATGNIAISGGGNYASDDNGVPSGDAAVPDAYGQIGNGDASRTAVQTVSGTILVQSGGQTNFASSAAAGSPAWLGNRTGDGGSQSGDVTLLAASMNGDGNALRTMFFEDLGTGASSGGDVTVGLSGTGPNGLAGETYDSPHDLTYLAGGDVYVTGSIQNDGTGAVTLVAGWDGQTLDPAALAQPGAYGNNNATLTIGGDYADGDVFVGSKGGATTVLTGNLDVSAVWGGAQLGYHGAGTGDITVAATGGIDVQGGDPGQGGFAAMIGNGVLNGPGGSGPVGGDIFLSAGGIFRLETQECDCDPGPGAGVTTFIGNIAGTGAQASGNLTLIASDLQDGDDANGGFGRILVADLVTGNVTIGETDAESAIELHDDFLYSSSHDLTLLSAGNIHVDSQLQNAGSGAITLVAGWDGHYDPSAIGAAGTFGLGSGSVVIGNGGEGVYDSSVGAAQGAVDVYTYSLVVGGEHGSAQLGYHGDGGGAINVVANGNLAVVAGDTPEQFALLGNGGLGGDVTGDVHGAINVRVEFGNTDIGTEGAGTGWLGNVTSGPGKASGDVTVVTDFGTVPTAILAADLGTSADTGGNVFLGYSDPDDGTVSFGGLSYNSPHNFTIASPTDLDIDGSIQNAGTGEVVAVAGWDEHTFGASAALLGANAFGLYGSTLSVEGLNVAVGSAGGLTTALASNVVLSGSEDGYAQLGWHGAGGGDIHVVATGGLTLSGGGSAAEYAMIGNGSLNGDVSGAVTGDIDIHVSGAAALYPGEGLQNAWIGNSGTGGFSGDLLLVTGDFNDGGHFGANVAADLAGGDVTVAITDPDATSEIDDSIGYSSSHAFNLLSAGSFTFEGQVQNSGSGAINVVAGWNGTTLDPAHFADAGVYGNNQGSVTVGGAGANVAALLGSAGGTTTVLGYDISVAAENAVAQLGYLGSGHGAIVATALNDVSVVTGGPNTYAIIGNGSVAAPTAASGDITVAAGHDVLVTAGAVATDAKIGNGEIGGQGATSGDILVTAGDAVAVSTTSSSAFAQIGNGDTTQSDVSGTIAVTAAAVSLSTSDTESSAQIGHSGAARMNGAITIDAAAVSLTAGADSSTTQIGNGGPGAVGGSVTGNVSFGGDITINATDSLTMTTANQDTGVWIGNGGDNTAAGLTLPGALSYSGDIKITVGTTAQAGALTMNQNGAGGSTMWIGNGGYGAGQNSTVPGGLSASGDITIDVLGGITHGATVLVSDTGTAAGFDNIGNGRALLSGANVSGDIGIDVDGDLSFVGTPATPAFAGNILLAPGTVAGNLDITAQSLSGVETSLAVGLAAGDVRVEVLGSDPLRLSQSFSYDSNHDLIVLAAGDVEIESSVQNAGTGDIDVVAGWDGTTTDPAHFADHGVFGQGGGSVLIGGEGAAGASSLGTARGTLDISANDVTVAAVNGDAQLGYLGAGDGAIAVTAAGQFGLHGGVHAAQIGNSATFGDNTGSGDVTIAAATIADPNGAIVGDAVDLSAYADDIGESDDPIRVASNSLAITTAGGDAHIVSPNNAVTLAGVDLGDGLLDLTAVSIGQTASISAAALDLQSTGGAITLTDAGNSFAALTVTTGDGDDAAVTDAGGVTVGGADVGGTFTLHAGGAIGQSGAIQAGALVLSAASGNIALYDSGNVFDTLSVTTGDGADASVTDSVALAIAGADVGGTLWLTAPGISQTGAITAAELDVNATSGTIALANSGNAFDRLSVWTSDGEDASVADSRDLRVVGAGVGGTLTLVSAKGITQASALQAGGLDATANGGALALTNAGNSFAKLSATTADGFDAAVVDSTSVALTGGDVGGTFTLGAGGAITQTAGFAADAFVVSTTSGAISLTHAGNDVATLDVTTHGSDNAAFVDSAALTVANATVGGTLSLTGASIGQTGAIVAAALNASATAGAITLNDAGNSFAALAVSTAAGNDAAVTDSTAVTLGASGVGGTFTLAAGGAIAQSGALTAALLDVSTTTGAIALTNAGNKIAALDATTHGADNATFADSTGLTVAGASVGGTLGLTAAGIDQTGAIAAGGLNVASPSGAITLTNAGNRFATLAVATHGADNATIVDSAALTVAGANVGGTLGLTGTSIAQTGAIAAAGLRAAATTGAITLTNGANAFGALVVSTTGSNGATVTDSTAVALGGSTVGGTFALTAGGAITQTAALAAATLNVSSTSGAITLTNAGNSFGALGVSTTGGNNASVADSTAVALGSTAVGGAFTLAAGGAITQTAALTAAGLKASATTGAITLTNAGNGFGTLALTTTGGFGANVVDSTAVALGSTSVGGTFTLAAGGAVTQTAALTAAGLNVSATTGAITLTNAANAFGTLAVSTAGAGNASVVDSTAVALGSTSVGGAFTLSAGGAITQTAALTSGALNLSTTAGAIALTNGANSFGPLTVATHGSDNAALSSGGQITVASAHVGGTLTLLAGSGIGQTGAIQAAGLKATANGGAIVLTNAGNSFGALGVSTTGGNNASVADSTAVALGSTAVGGTFTLAAGGAITQTAALTAAGLNASTSAGPIALTNAGNAFGTLAASTAGDDNASIADSTAVALGASAVGGTFTLSAGGAITQTAALTAGGLNASTTAGAITLTHAGNAFGTLSLTTAASFGASVADTTAVALGASAVGGTLILSADGAITQLGALTAGALNVSTSSGAIALTNAGNAFATLSAATAGGFAASVADSTAVALGATAVGGTFTLNAGGAITQTAALTAGGLAASTSSGGIQLGLAANSVAGLTRFTAPGAVLFANGVSTTIGASSVGGDLTLLSKGNVTVTGAVQGNGGAVTVVAGWNGTTTDAAHFGDGGVSGNNSGSLTVGGGAASGNASLGSKSGATAVYASSVNILGVHGSAQLGYRGAGGGAITVRAVHDVTLTAGAGDAFLGNGALGAGVTGNQSGDIDVRAGGNIALSDSPGGQAWIGNVAHSGSETGNLVLVANDITSTADTRVGDIASAAIAGGDVTLGFTGTQDTGTGQNYAFSSGHAFNLLAAGNIVFAGTLQNSGSGAINVVAGWDGHTLAPAAFGNANVAGNGGKGVTIGGAAAAGNVALGSAAGKTSVYGASLALAATNGYAQLGFNGHGAGAIAVAVTGGVTLTGGAAAGDFAQIGNGGLKTGGNNSGDIAIAAGGDVVLTAGTGGEAYVQIGHGGAESNTGATGYSNQGAITLGAANLTLDGGTGAAAYAMIGQGGFKSGLNLAGGTAVNSGDIAVTAAHQVTLLGGGADGFVQIGNGGSQSNLNPVAAAGGTDSGLVTVTAPNGPGGALSLTAGAGPNAYAQIGNGGYAVNSGPTSTVANFTVTGNIQVTDLALVGGGDNSFALIGNGDASRNSYGNISGDIIIDANGNIVYTAGSGTHAPATIGNFTGQGTVSGTITGAHPPSESGGVTTDPTTIGTVVTTTAGNVQKDSNPPITTINTQVVTPPPDDTGATTLGVHLEDTAPPGPLAALDTKGADSSTPNASDSATVVIADSLDGAKKPTGTQFILGGMLKQVTPANGAHGVHAVPPAGQDFSSWGNEALWQ